VFTLYYKSLQSFLVTGAVQTELIRKQTKPRYVITSEGKWVYSFKRFYTLEEQNGREE